MSDEREEALAEEKCDNAEEERYTLTPWRCLYAVLLSYGIQISLSDGKEISGKVGAIEELHKLNSKIPSPQEPPKREARTI